MGRKIGEKKLSPAPRTTINYNWLANDTRRRHHHRDGRVYIREPMTFHLFCTGAHRSKLRPDGDAKVVGLSGR